MYKIIIYEKDNGKSELKTDLDNLIRKAEKSKDARIQFNQITLMIELLQINGTNLPIMISKHIYEDIWELRPGHNRILYFYFGNETFVLLHMFRKMTQKTPKRELEKAIKERNDYLLRNGGHTK